MPRVPFVDTRTFTVIQLFGLVVLVAAAIRSLPEARGNAFLEGISFSCFITGGFVIGMLTRRLTTPFRKSASSAEVWSLRRVLLGVAAMIGGTTVAVFTISLALSWEGSTAGQLVWIALAAAGAYVASVEARAYALAELAIWPRPPRERH